MNKDAGKDAMGVNFMRNRIYMDNAASSFPKPDCVAEEVFHFIKDLGSNVGRGSYSSAYEAEDMLFETRELLADLFGADDARNVIFTPGITWSLNILLKGLLRPGDHVLTSSMEHNAVMRPLAQLEEDGVSFSRIPCSRTGRMDLDQIPSMIRPCTRVMVLTHASNVTGAVNPIEELGEICQKYGLIFIVDSAQTAGLLPLDMQKLHIDALAFTGHKSLLGPQGTGGFVLREGLCSQIRPLVSGGTGSISHMERVPDFMPDRFEPGTMNLPGICGLRAALLWRKKLKDPAEILRSEMALTDYFLEGLLDIEGLKLVGRADPGQGMNYMPLVSLQICGLDSAEAAAILDEEYGIACRVGLHCAPAAHKSFGSYPEGTIRFSFGHKNTREEVDILLDALRKISRERVQQSL